VQTPNLKAEYTTEPVLIAKTNSAAQGTRTADDRVAADLRAFERSGDPEFSNKFLETEARGKIAEWRRLAEGGVPAAQVLLAYCFRDGCGVGLDDGEAVKWFRKAADAGEARGMTGLGTMYQHLRVVDVHDTEVGHKEAVKYYRKAANAGDPGGMILLGNAFDEGIGAGIAGKVDFKEALQWYKKAADAGYPSGEYLVGRMYHSGRGVQQDLKEAVKWYTKAADAGLFLSMSMLATMYEYGRGVEKDEKMALEWYEKSLQAGGGDLERAAIKRLRK
jgi:hypothetical protein